VITLLGATLALSGADFATVGAVAPQLEHSLQSAIPKIGLLSSAGFLVGAVFTIPVGLLVDLGLRRVAICVGSAGLTIGLMRQPKVQPRNGPIRMRTMWQLRP
jgi:MFS family permease